MSRRKFSSIPNRVLSRSTLICQWEFDKALRECKERGLFWRYDFVYLRLLENLAPIHEK